jgi:hypothetical protein
MRLIVGASLVVGVCVALLAGKNDINRLRQMRRM